MVERARYEPKLIVAATLRRMVGAGFIHQVPGGGPVAVTIEQRTDDSAIQYSGERFVFLFRLPLCDHFIAFRETANAQAFGIGRSAAPT